jgi:hypothetical protein
MQLRDKTRSVIESNTVEIEYVEPADQDAEALKLLSADSQPLFFSGNLGGQPQVIQELLRRYPKSIYACHGRARIILDSETRFLNYSGDLTAAQKQEADTIISQALAFVQEYPEMPISDNILLSCARVQRRAGKREEALETLKRIVREYGDSDARDAAKELLQVGPSPEDLLRLRRSHDRAAAVVVPPAGSADGLTSTTSHSHTQSVKSHATSRPAGTRPADTRPAGASATRPAPSDSL